MSAIVDELRRMSAAPTEQFTDADLEVVLAQRISDRPLQAPIERIATVAEGGARVVLDGQVAVAGTLDAENAAVFALNGAAVSGVTIHGDGRLAFDADQSQQSLLLTGLAYDLNAAAADVLEQRAAGLAEGYDITVDGQTMKRSQRHAQLLEQAKAYRSKAVIKTVRLTRSDVRRRPR